MTKLFGIDIAKTVNDAISAAGGVQKLTLIRQIESVRNPINPTAGLTYAPAEYDCQGIVEIMTDKVGSEPTVVENTYISILGASLPVDIRPTPKDKVRAGGKTYKISRIEEVDPAQAMYKLLVKE